MGISQAFSNPKDACDGVREALPSSVPRSAHISHQLPKQDPTQSQAACESQSLLPPGYHLIVTTLPQFSFSLISPFPKWVKEHANIFRGCNRHLQSAGPAWRARAHLGVFFVLAGPALKSCSLCSLKTLQGTRAVLVLVMFLWCQQGLI